VRALAKSIELLTTYLGAPGSASDKPWRARESLEAPRITVKQAGKHDSSGHVADASGKHSYYLLFNHF